MDEVLLPSIGSGLFGGTTNEGTIGPWGNMQPTPPVSK